MSFFKKILKKNKLVYTISLRTYVLLKKLSVSIFGTKVTEFEWKNAYSDGSLFDDFCKSNSSYHKVIFYEEVSKCSAIKRVLEIGCGTGTNLFYLRNIFPDAEFVGIDINMRAIDLGNKYFLDKGIQNIKLFMKGADRLRDFKAESFDLVFSIATLMYVGNDKIEEVVRHSIKLSSNAIIFVEFNKESGRDYYNGYHWIRDYKKIIEKYLNTSSSASVRYFNGNRMNDANWDKYGAVIKVLKLNIGSF
jgi:ubiquinone/menaquinone biosynthesis C-methylase UbiE